jgi:hypothetical protein
MYVFIMYTPGDVWTYVDELYEICGTSTLRWVTSRTLEQFITMANFLHLYRQELRGAALYYISMEFGCSS